MLERLGIQTRLQLAIALCVIALVTVTTLGGSGGSTPAFFTYRSLLLIIAVLCVIGCRRESRRIDTAFLGIAALSLLLMLVSVLRLEGSHFDGLYLWYKHAFFIAAFLGLAWYSQYQTARWKQLLLAAVVALNILHVLPDLVSFRQPFAGFSSNNVNYFGTFLLTGLGPGLALAVFGTGTRMRIAAACTTGLLFFGITQTWSRGALLAAVFMIAICAVRAGNRIPRRIWLLVTLLGLIVVVAASPYLIRKFLDLGQGDPYNYARTEIWRGAFHVIGEEPFLGVGFGQYVNASKRFTFPVNADVVARYLKRAQMAHSEYLHHIAESGIPAAFLLFSLFGYALYLAWQRAATAPAENRIFHEAAILTVAGVGTHGLVDNCWTIPVTASTLVVLALADVLPLQNRTIESRWPRLQFLTAAIVVLLAWGHSVLVPAAGFYYNDKGHQAYERADYINAERGHLAALHFIPDNPLFLDNLGMVYFQQFIDTRRQELLEPARQYFAKAIEAAPQSLNAYIHMETLLIRTMTSEPQHDLPLYKSLIENNTRFIAIDPFIPFVRKNLAEAFYRTGQPDAAFEVLSQAIEHEPNYVPGYLQFSSWYRDMGKIAESQQYERKAVEIVLKYRDFKTREPYEGILLGRPEESFLPKGISPSPGS